MLSRVVSAATLLLLLVPFCSSIWVFAENPCEIAVVNLGNNDFPDKWTAGPPHEVGTGLFSFCDDETDLNDTFYVGIQIYNVVNLFIWTFMLSFNSSLVRCTEVWRPGYHIFAGHENIWPTFLEIDNEAGYVACGCELLPPDPGVSGNGTLSLVRFQIVRTPGENETLTCDLALDKPGAFATGACDPDFNDIPLLITNGSYEYKYDPWYLADVNHDGKVDIIDVAMTSAAFGSYPGHPKWNPACDVNSDGKVDIIDLAIVCGNYGKFRPP